MPTPSNPPINRLQGKNPTPSGRNSQTPANITPKPYNATPSSKNGGLPTTTPATGEPRDNGVLGHSPNRVIAFKRQPGLRDVGLREKDSAEPGKRGVNDRGFGFRAIAEGGVAVGGVVAADGVHVF